jgi:hypothetical protein
MESASGRLDVPQKTFTRRVSCPLLQNGKPTDMVDFQPIQIVAKL